MTSTMEDSKVLNSTEMQSQKDRGIYSHYTPNQPQHDGLTSSKEILDKIIVGYAFGPKKMETMGRVMDQASKALSTFECGEGVLPTLTQNCSNQQQDYYSEALEMMEESSVTNSAASTLTNHYHPGGFDDEEDLRSLSSTPSQRNGGNGNSSNSNNMRGIQLTFMPDASGSLHLINTNSSSSGSHCGDSYSLATTADVTTSTTMPRKHQSRQSCGSEKCDEVVTSTSYRHPIRVSFVPIELDKPLEEQHGGKFDVILHKMTEDILCLSKMLQFSTNDVGKHWIHQDVKPLDLVTPTETMTRHQARASRRIQRLREYKKIINPSCVLVDPPSNILALMSRADMAEIMSSCLAGVTTKAGIPVRTPRFKVVNEDVELESADFDVLANEIDSAGFAYPLIAKPLTAAGTKSSHHMGIVLARDGLQRLKTPCLLQEYANHGETLFKVYVLGNSVWTFSRQSMPNLPLGEKEIIPTIEDRERTNSQMEIESNLSENDASPGSNKKRRCDSYVEFERPAGSRCYVEFNSQRPYPTISDFGKLHDAPRNKEHRFSPNPSPVMSSSSQEPRQQDDLNSPPLENDLARFVTREEIEPVTNSLRAAFGLDLFGFDVLVKEGDNGKEILVVDVNYFPGYKEVPNL